MSDFNDLTRMRQKSLFTLNSYPIEYEELDSHQYYPTFTEYCDLAPPLEKYVGEPKPSSSMMSFISADVWDSDSASKFLEYPVFVQDEMGKNCMKEGDEAQYVGDVEQNIDTWVEERVRDEVQEVEAQVSPHGIISIDFPHCIRVDLTVDKAIRISSFNTNTVLSLSAGGSSAAFLHPNGKIHQYGSRVECVVYGCKGNNKYAKMWYKGVSFTSDESAVVYLVDEAGIRTTNDKFSDMTMYDPSASVFYTGSSHGSKFIREAKRQVEESQFWESRDETLNFIINNIKISQLQDGLIRVSKDRNKYLLRTSPTNGNTLLKTHFLHCTGSMGRSPHMFVRRGERRMHTDCANFVVRNAGHSAGFDETGKLKVY